MVSKFAPSSLTMFNVTDKTPIPIKVYFHDKSSNKIVHAASGTEIKDLSSFDKVAAVHNDSEAFKGCATMSASLFGSTAQKAGALMEI